MYYLPWYIKLLYVDEMTIYLSNIKYRIPFFAFQACYIYFPVVLNLNYFYIISFLHVPSWQDIISLVNKTDETLLKTGVVNLVQI